VLALVALPKDDGAGRERDLIEQVEEGAEIARPDMSEKAVLCEERDIVGAVARREREDCGRGCLHELR
jgi:hypothetical protein